MKGKCEKCGFEGDLHQVGRLNIPFVILQCPKCCFIHSIIKLLAKGMWKCKNPECLREFPMPATMTVKLKPKFLEDPTVIEKVCCPFCNCIDLERVTETKKD